MARNLKKFRITRKLAVISTVIVIVVVGGGMGFWHYHNRLSQNVITSTPGKSTAPLGSSSANQSSSSTVSSSDKQTPSSGGYSSSASQGPSDGTGQPPLVPSGQFVSNHNPRNNSTSTEQSVCNTTPGASCYIQFTKGSDTRTLVTQTTDINGTTIWNWDAISFPSGIWQISAIASLNGQTKTAQDQMDLVVQ